MKDGRNISLHGGPLLVGKRVMKTYFEARIGRTRFLSNDILHDFQLEYAFLAPAVIENPHRHFAPAVRLPGTHYDISQLSTPARQGRNVGMTNSMGLASELGVPRRRGLNVMNSPIPISSVRKGLGIPTLQYCTGKHRAVSLNILIPCIQVQEVHFTDA